MTSLGNVQNVLRRPANEAHLLRPETYGSLMQELAIQGWRRVHHIPLCLTVYALDGRFVHITPTEAWHSDAMGA